MYKDDWLDGTGIYYWFSHNVFGAPEILQKYLNIITLSSVAPLISWGVIFLELSLFACIVATNRKILIFFLYLGIAFHFGIFIVHGLMSFFFSMTGALVLYLDRDNYIFNFLKTLYYGKNR